MIELPFSPPFMSRAFLGRHSRPQERPYRQRTSPASYIAWPNAAGYIAARQALKGFSEALRLEAAASGVLVGLVVLGPLKAVMGA